MQPQLTILWQCFMRGHNICDDVAWSTRGAIHQCMAIKWGMAGVPYFQTNLNWSCPVSYNIHQYTLIRPLYQLYTNYIPTIYQLYTNYTSSNLMKAMLISEKAQTWEIWLRPWPILQLVVSALFLFKKKCSFSSLYKYVNTINHKHT